MSAIGADISTTTEFGPASNTAPHEPTTKPLSPFPHCPVNLFHPLSVVSNDHNDKGEVVAHNKMSSALPSFLKHEIFQTRHGPVSFYSAKAENEKAIVFGPSGFKYDFSLTPKDIKDCLNNGISVAWTALPNVNRALNFMPAYIETVSEVFKNPPLKSIEDILTSDVSKSFLGHSTGSQIFYHLIKDNDIFRTINETFNGVALSSAYIKCTGFDNKRMKKIFDHVCQKHPNKTTVETWEGRTYMRLKGRDITDRELPGLKYPTFAQIRELLKYGTPILEESSNPEANMNKLGIPVIFFGGEKDGYSSPQTQFEMAANTGSALYLDPKSKHAPLTESQTARSLFIKSVHAMADGTFETFANENDLYPQQRDQTPFWNKIQQAKSLVTTSVLKPL